MCHNDIVAFGMNMAEILLSVFVFACIAVAGVLMLMYLEGRFSRRDIDLIDIDLYSKEELKNIRKYGR